MDEGTAVLLGAVVGAASTLGATWLSHHLKISASEKLNEKRKRILRGRLNSSKYFWHDIKNLAAAVGADEQATIGLLLEIGARASLSNNGSWALETRRPYPVDVQPLD